MEQPAGVSVNKISEIPIRSYAHIGDAVYELYAREKTIYLTSKPEKLHKITISIVNAKFQANLLEKIENILTYDEKRSFEGQEICQ